MQRKKTAGMVQMQRASERIIQGKRLVEKNHLIQSAPAVIVRISVSAGMQVLATFFDS